MELFASRSNELSKALGRSIPQVTVGGVKTNDAGDSSFFYAIQGITCDLDAATGKVTFAIDHHINYWPRVEEFRRGSRPQPKQTAEQMLLAAEQSATSLVGPLPSSVRHSPSTANPRYGQYASGFSSMTREWSFTWQRFQGERKIPGEFLLIKLDDDTGKFATLLNRVRAEDYVLDARPVVPAGEILKKAEAHRREWSARIRGPKAPCHVYFADEPVLVAVSPALLPKAELARQPKPQLRDGKRVIRLAYLVRDQFFEEPQDLAKLRAEANDMWNRLLWDAHTGRRMEHGYF